VHLLEKDTVTIEDVTFVGGTLWTDFNREDSLCMWNAGQSMNDYRVCKNSGRGITGGGYASRLQPEDTLADHKAMLDYIRIVTEGQEGKKFVVAVHHAHSYTAVTPSIRVQKVIQRPNQLTTRTSPRNKRGYGMR
jgi:hypothetical protein